MTKYKGRPETIKRFFEQREGIAEPEYPDGQIDETDEGALAFAIGLDRKNKIILIDFNKSVTWLGLDIKSAVQMHQVLGDRIVELSKAIANEQTQDSNLKETPD